jgi:hypothetical protein
MNLAKLIQQKIWINKKAGRSLGRRGTWLCFSVLCHLLFEPEKSFIWALIQLGFLHSAGKADLLSIQEKEKEKECWKSSA